MSGELLIVFHGLPVFVVASEPEDVTAAICSVRISNSGKGQHEVWERSEDEKRKEGSIPFRDQ